MAVFILVTSTASSSLVWLRGAQGCDVDDNDDGRTFGLAFISPEFKKNTRKLPSPSCVN